MRIISGKYRGKKLLCLEGDETRPTLDRAKESIFNILASHLHFNGLTVLDCFAGTGALGLEALSRGAASVTFIERSKEAAHIIKENINSLKEHTNCHLLNKDIFELEHSLNKADLIFIDPPYKKGLVPICISHLLKTGWVKKESLFVIEMAKDEQEPELLNLIRIMDVRHYGNSQFVFAYTL